MTEANKATRMQRAIEGLGGLLARNVIKINQQVAAKNHVEIAVAAHVGRFHQIHAGELDGAAQVVAELEAGRGFAKIFLQIIAWHMLDRAFRVQAGAGLIQDFGIDVRRDNFDVPVVDAGPAFDQAHRNRIRLFSRGRRDHPDADRRLVFFARHQIGQDRIDQTMKLIFLAKEISFVDRHQVHQRLQFVAGGLKTQHREIAAKAVVAGRFDAFDQTLVDEIALRGFELDTGLAIKEFLEFQEVVIADGDFRHGGLRPPRCVSRQDRSQTEYRVRPQTVRAIATARGVPPVSRPRPASRRQYRRH